MKMNFDFVNVYVKDVYKGIKHTDEAVISEIEFLVEDKTKTINKDKYDYLYDELKIWYESNDGVNVVNDSTHHFFYPDYSFLHKASNYDAYFEKKKQVYLSPFKDAIKMIDFGKVPKKQFDFFEELPTSFDMTKKTALLYSTSRNNKHKNTFFVYLKHQNETVENKNMPLHFPFMNIIGTSFMKPIFTKRIAYSNIFGKRLDDFFNKNKDIEHIFLVRTYDNKKTGMVKYAFYYSNETINTKNSRQITGESNDVDPCCIFIFDTKGRLVKVLYKEYDEIHYYIIWDEKNKIEKILILEAGEFGLKGISTILAEK